MTEMDPIALAEKLTLIAALVFAVWWLNRGNSKRDEKLEVIRAKHDLAQENRVADLEKRSEACEEDRSKLWKDVGDLRVEVERSKKVSA